MSIHDFLDSFEDDATLHNSFTLSWSKQGIGFGQYRFYTDEEGRIHIDNEMMGRESIKKMLGIMVDKAILDDQEFMYNRQCLNKFTPTSSLSIIIPPEYNHSVEFVSVIDLLNIPYIRYCQNWDNFKYFAKLQNWLVVVTDTEDMRIIGTIDKPDYVDLHDMVRKHYTEEEINE